MPLDEPFDVMGTRRRGGVMDDGGKEQEPGSLLRHPVAGRRGHVSELEYRVERALLVRLRPRGPSAVMPPDTLFTWGSDLPFEYKRAPLV